jgi:hypothetical protein
VVLLDVLGVGFDQFPAALREDIVAKYPRINFKQGFIDEYVAGFAHKPATAYGNASFCERFTEIQESQCLRLDRCIAISGFHNTKLNIMRRTRAVPRSNRPRPAI